MPHHVQTTGLSWMVASVVLVSLTIIVFAGGIRGAAVAVTVVDDAVVRWLTELQLPGLTAVFEGLAQVASWVTMTVLWTGLVVALLVVRRFRHLLVLVIATELVVAIHTVAIGAVVHRPRPFGVDIDTSWGGWAMPSVQVSVLAATLVAVLYSLVPAGGGRNIGKWAAAVLVAGVGVARVALGAEAPTDVMVGAVVGVTIVLLAFRLFTPDEAFPITYGRGRSAHLDVGGARGVAIRRGLEDQLGLVIADVEPFGLAGSAGSTPLRITVDAEPPLVLFGKLYAKTHLRADRWYKLGRELLYGRLEDEKPYNSVRRLVQQEDYALSLMQRAGLPSPTPLGFVELTPEREYLLVTEFFDGAVELGDAEVDDHIIDDGLAIVRKLWDAGLAHRDIKPANLLVRDGRLLLIDVAFVEIRPSPWRQAVDLANMMLCLALRSDPERVYARARRQFTVDDVSEAFAAARSLALPSQLRRLLRAQGRDLHAEFVRLLPTPPRPIRVQRWSIRRIILWTALMLLLVLITANARSIYHDWFGGGVATETSLHTDSLACDEWEPLWLQAQAVPTATLVPCVRTLPAAWTVANVAVNDGRSVITVSHDRAGDAPVEVTFRFSVDCDVTAAAEGPSAQAGVRRYQPIEGSTGSDSAVWYDRFAGGCVTARVHSTTELGDGFANELPAVLGYISRQALADALETRSDGRLHLDPDTGS